MVSRDVLGSVNQYIKHKHLLRSETQPETSRKDETDAEEAKEVFPFLKHGVNILSLKKLSPISKTLCTQEPQRKTAGNAFSDRYPTGLAQQQCLFVIVQSERGHYIQQRDQLLALQRVQRDSALMGAGPTISSGQKNGVGS